MPLRLINPINPFAKLFTTLEPVSELFTFPVIFYVKVFFEHFIVTELWGTHASNAADASFYVFFPIIYPRAFPDCYPAIAPAIIPKSPL